MSWSTGSSVAQDSPFPVGCVAVLMVVILLLLSRAQISVVDDGRKNNLVSSEMQERGFHSWLRLVQALPNA